VGKKRIVKDFEKLPEEILYGIKIQYPNGFRDFLIFYSDKEGKRVSALPFETEDIYYLVRMTENEAEQIVEDDEDYDETGTLRDGFTLIGIDEKIVDSVPDEEEPKNKLEDEGDLQIL